MMSEDKVEIERRCPRCGEPLYMLTDRDWTLGEIKVVDLICANCLYTDKLTTIVARRDG